VPRAVDARALADKRRSVLLAGAAQWSDPASDVRRAARARLAGEQWPAPVIEAALDNVLRDADAFLSRIPDADAGGLRVLAILPGNVIGPAVAVAYCAAAAGSTILLKASHRELHLADIVAEQFETLGPPVAGTLRALRWSGGDADFEAKVFGRVDRILVFGDDETIADVRRRAPPRVEVIGYGTAYSIAFVGAGADVQAAADAAARDIALFDQRGCLSPQSVYVEGGEARAILFAHALRDALLRIGVALPRALAGDAEKAAVAEFVRRLRVRALPPAIHALDTILIGPQRQGVPDFVVGVEPYSPPACAGFGRIAIVKPCATPDAAASAAAALGARLDTVGVAGGATSALRHAFLAAGALRVCRLGEMQRPPLGYRPTLADFLSRDST
jgi:hypothetical protein